MSDPNAASTAVMEAPYEVTGAEDPAAKAETKDASPGADASVTADEGKPAPADEQGPPAEDSTGKEAETEDAAKQAELLDKVSKATREEATETLKQNGLDFGRFEQEYLANGELSEDSYKALEKAGIGKEYVDVYIKGNEALLQQFVAEVNDMAGGQEQYKSMTEWAAANLPQDEVGAFNAVMSSGNKPMIKIAVSGLVSRYRDAEGMEPALVRGKASSASGPAGGSFASAAEMTQAMSDPRYGKDSAYTREVERKTGNSTFFA